MKRNPRKAKIARHKWRRRKFETTERCPHKKRFYKYSKQHKDAYGTSFKALTNNFFTPTFSNYQKQHFDWETHLNYLFRRIGNRNRDRILFLTLTFPHTNPPLSPQEVSERWNSFATNYLKRNPAVKEWVRVIEPAGISRKDKKLYPARLSMRKRLHIHAILVLDAKSPLRARKSRFQLEYIRKNKHYKRLPKVYRAWWDELRRVLPRYGFGRHDLYPVYSKNQMRFVKYFIKYLRICGSQGKPKYLKGVRLITCCKSFEKYYPGALNSIK